MRVSTLSRHDTSVKRIQDTNARIAELSYQVTSGFKGNRFEDYANESNQMLNLKDFTRSSNIYVDNIKTVSKRLEATEKSLDAIQNLALEAASLRTLANNANSPESRSAMAPKAKGIAESFYNVFNSKFEGRYLFSGQRSEEPPTTVAATANPATGLPAPTAYYTGDTAQLQTIISPGATESYGVTGDHPAFASFKAGIEALWFGLENDSDIDIQGAISLLEEAENQLNNLTGEVGGAINGLKLTQDRHSSAVLFTQERIDDLEKVDVSEALTEFQQVKTQLEASMLVITQTNQLSLLDFIR